MHLYSFFRSSASWRVRIALHLKGLEYDFTSVHLRKDGGQQNAAKFKALNPQGLVPALEDGDVVLNQSLAMLEYLDEKHPRPPLLFGDAPMRARIRAAAQVIACEIHPLNNLRVLQYLGQELGLDEDARNQWYAHWVKVNFDGLEQMIEGSGQFCFGGAVSLADICLVPQVFNAERFNVDLSSYPKIASINAFLLTMPAFAETAPDKQPDVE
jgi:maleylacetoacetate isomerase